ncbi:peptidoglycan DD-metalloendopeptidase family protein [Litorivicinus sp.]|nr:peptidoglycan DD-metalloendopeptidase family protein [Litorivicinus sp.]
MRALINRFNSACHPFPGIHVLGVSASALFITALLNWPNALEAKDSASKWIPIPNPFAGKSSLPHSLEEPAFIVKKDTVKSGDSLSRLFQRQGLSPQLLTKVTSSESRNNAISRLSAGKNVEFRYLSDSLREVAVIQSPFSETVAVNRDNEWAIEQRHREPEIYIEYAKARIDSSLFLAGARAGLPDNLIMELASIYGHVIDFVYEIRRGDTFYVTFEKRYLDGQFIEYGDILAAQFVNKGEVFSAIRYPGPSGDAGYYDEKGVSLRKAFLRAPLNFNRISSNFKLFRKHPVLGKMRAHKGTDYAASRGTPVYASGDGKIIYRARKGGFGNLVVIRHGNNIETRYAHLSKFGRYRLNSKVQQGQTIGYVGTTGLSTGPHLHYEFIINGVHRNPRTIIEKLPKAKSLPKTELAQFQKFAEPLIASLEVLNSNAELAYQNISK